MPECRSYSESNPMTWIRGISIAIALFSALSARGEDAAAYQQGRDAFNAGDYDRAAEIFFGLNQQPSAGDIRLRSQYYLALSLARKGLWVSSLRYYAAILQAGKSHPFRFEAVQGLVELQDRLKDQDVIPNLLNNHFSEDWKAVPPAALARIHYLVATIQFRR